MLALDIEPRAKINQLIWSSSNEDIVSVSPLGVVFGKKAGYSADITVAATDGSNLTSKATVTVLDPELNIEGPRKALVNESINLKAIYGNTEESGVQYSWSTVGVNGAATEDVVFNSNEEQASFTATKSGEYTVNVLVTTDLNKIGIPKSLTIIVGLDSLTITGPISVSQEGTITLNAVTDPISVL